MTICAKIIADSVGPHGIRITTFELEYPRFIHAEFMTHRLFSRNAASSRAIPVKRAIELIQEDTAMPIHWGKNQPGMSAKEECENGIDMASLFEGFVNPEDAGWAHATRDIPREAAWSLARNAAIEAAEAFSNAGYHKQIVNRLLEPFSHIKVVCTATEYDNFFYLRCHPDAQPEIQRLAELMYEAREKSTPIKLGVGDWHVPYFGLGYWHSHRPERQQIGHANTLEDAIAISASCCAQVSYRKADDSVEKAKLVYDRLVNSKPVHASPFEHQATPMRYGADSENMEPGITHFSVLNQASHELHGMALDGWSGNFRGWIQNRQLIPENANWSYAP